jgi:hypothetical protein
VEAKQQFIATCNGIHIQEETLSIEGRTTKVFEAIAKVMRKETLMRFPDFAKPFHIYADASNNQLGSVIMQDRKPLAFYSHDLNITTSTASTEPILASCHSYVNLYAYLCNFNPELPVWHFYCTNAKLLGHNRITMVIHH